MSYSCLSGATVDGNLTYVTGGAHTCTVHGSVSSQSGHIAEQPMPIPQSQIDAWKSAAASKVVNGNTTINGNQSIGPEKIIGNLTVNGGVTLTLTGPIYVTGDITFQNNDIVQLGASYGSLGEVILSER